MKTNMISRLFIALIMSLVLIGTVFAQIQTGINVDADVNGNSLAVSAQTRTMQKANLGQMFKAEAGMTFNLENKYQVKVTNVFNNPNTDVIPGANVELTRINLAAEEAPEEYYLTLNQPVKFKNKLIIQVMEISGNAVVLVATELSGTITPSDDGVIFVTLNQEFKAKEDQIFLINDRVKLIVTEINDVNNAVAADQIRATIEMHDYLSDPRMMRPILASQKFQMGIQDTAEYLGYTVTLIEASDDAVALKVTMNNPEPVPPVRDPSVYQATTTSNGLMVQSAGAVPVAAKRLTVSPGNADAVFESDEGKVDVTPGMLRDGLDLQIQNRGETSTLRITANEQRLETYIAQGDVEARTRETVVSDENGLALELSNGQRADVKVLPEQASDKAKEVLTNIFGALELKEVGAKAAYEAKSREKFRIFGFIPASGDVSVTVDAETGDITKIKKPWFSFMSSQVKE